MKRDVMAEIEAWQAVDARRRKRERHWRDVMLEALEHSRVRETSADADHRNRLVRRRSA
jgi:hypothetical protein